MFVASGYGLINGLGFVCAAGASWVHCWGDDDGGQLGQELPWVVTTPEDVGVTGAMDVGVFADATTITTATQVLRAGQSLTLPVVERATRRSPCRPP